MNSNIIDIQGLSRKFRKNFALKDINLQIPKGAVLGLVGENGAGKTTLIKHILGLFRAQSGSVRVFGFDPVQDPVAVLARIGYLSENRDMPQWMCIHELINYTRAFYPDWDIDYANELLNTFDLDSKQRIKDLSRGQRALTGLLMALAYKPDLLLFDEPSSGLDPVVRRDILGAIVQAITDEGRTVVFSSHLLDEVQQIADQVAMINQGEVVFSDSMSNIQKDHYCLTLRFKEPQNKRPVLPGALSCTGSALEWRFLCTGSSQDMPEKVKEQNAEIIEQTTPSLEEIFVAHVKKNHLN